MDFVNDQPTSGRSASSFAVIDHIICECVEIETGYVFCVGGVIKVMSKELVI